MVCLSPASAVVKNKDSGLRLAFTQLRLKNRQFMVWRLFLCIWGTMVFWGSIAHADDTPRWGRARSLTAVFSSREGASGVVSPDRCGQVRTLEFVALPDTVFSIVGADGDGRIFEVSTTEYKPPKGKHLYLSAQNLNLSPFPLQDPIRKRPTVDRMLDAMTSAVGVPYVWGANSRTGVFVAGLNRFAGLDCSGLLYEASAGTTPRNTEQLVHFGWGVPIAGLAPRDVARLLKPLDLIVWNGHVLIVGRDGQVFESILRCGSKQFSGVVMRPLYERLYEIARNRRAADVWTGGKEYVVRRWVSP